MKNPIDFEIYEFYEPQWWDSTWAKVTLTILAILIVSGLVYLFLTRRRKPLTAGQQALKELAALRGKDFSTKKEVRIAYFTLTSIIKKYLSNQFGLRVLDKTDDEVIAFIEEKQFHAPTLEALKKIHSSGQLVKFANYDMIKTQAEQDLVVARQIVENLELLVEHQRKSKR
jgi:hypothetical protein